MGRLTIAQINQKIPKFSLLIACDFIESVYSSGGKKRNRVVCVCKCGKTRNADVTGLIHGNPYSCGCAKKYVKHKYGGKKYNRLHQMWRDIIGRIENTKHRSYVLYGEKGVKICEEWKDYDSFAEWALNNGYSDKLQIDKDIKGNGLLYSPETCSFVTPYENVCNRSTSKKYEYNGELLTLSQISIKTEIKYTKLKARIYGLGKTIDEAIAMGV